MLAIKRDFIDAYINLGELYIRRALYEQALDTYQTALQKAEYLSDAKTADLHYNIAVAKSLMVENSKMTLATKHQTLNEIAQSLMQAIQADSEHKEAMINLAILLQNVSTTGLRDAASPLISSLAVAV